MLQGKCALITGSVGGLGLAAAERFAAAGCNIVLSGLAEPPQIAHATAAIEALGVRALYSPAELVEIVDFVPVAVCVTTTAAPTTTAPEGSLTRPVIVPLETCATSGIVIIPHTKSHVANFVFKTLVISILGSKSIHLLPPQRRAETSFRKHTKADFEPSPR